MEDPLVLGTLPQIGSDKALYSIFCSRSEAGQTPIRSHQVAAGGKCPLCGGVGHVRTLDHYLPKSNFPIFTIMPTNLVPCCRDCNSEKLNAFALVKGNQTLHPYFDHEKFFNDKWVHARVIPMMPPVLEYFVVPPDDWDEDDKSRVRSHFLDYGLAEKFSVEAAADLPETIHTRRTTMSANSAQEFSLYLAEKGQTATLPINNWRRVMFAALAVDPWFCNQAFA